MPVCRALHLPAVVIPCRTLPVGPSLTLLHLYGTALRLPAVVYFTDYRSGCLPRWYRSWIRYPCLHLTARTIYYGYPHSSASSYAVYTQTTISPHTVTVGFEFLPLPRWCCCPFTIPLRCDFTLHCGATLPAVVALPRAVTAPPCRCYAVRVQPTFRFPDADFDCTVLVPVTGILGWICLIAAVIHTTRCAFAVTARLRAHT